MDVPRTAVVLDAADPTVDFPDGFSRKRKRMAVDAMVHTKNRVTDFGNQVEIVGHHEDRHLLFQRGERFNELFLDGKINVGGRFIEEKKLRLTGEGSRNEDALTLASGEIGERSIRELFEADFSERLERNFAALFGIESKAMSIEATHEDNVDRGDGEEWIKAHRLRHVAYLFAGLVGRFPEKGEGAAIRLKQAEHQFEQGRLAPAVRPDHAKRFAFGNRKGHVFQNQLSAIAKAQPFGNNNVG